VTLAMGQPLEPEICLLWTPRHGELARSEGLGPWLYMSLAHHGEVALDSNILAGFQRDYKMAAISCLYREIVLGRLLDEFNAGGVQVMALKGLYLGEVVYKDAALRPMADVDLLVREEHFERAGHELERLGYKPLVELNSYEDQFLKWPREYNLLGPYPTCIDLHRAVLAMDYYHFPAGILWDHAVESELHGHRIFYLSPEINLIHIALHNLNHASKLRDWLDLMLILRVKGFDFDRLIELAGSLGAMRPLFWVFRELRHKWGVATPGKVSASFGSYAPSWLEDRVIRSRLRYVWRLFARMSLFDGWKSRVRYLVIKLVRPFGRRSSARRFQWTDNIMSKVTLFWQFWRKP